MNLVIDKGNTRVKIALINEGEILNTFISEEFSIAQLKEIHLKSPRIKKAILSSVTDVSYPILSFLKEQYEFLELSGQTKTPLVNKYLTPDTLGRDRLAGAVGAAQSFPKKDVLIIDAGTCITYDIVTKSNEYLGGSISPGIAMRFKALHAFTGKLPAIEDFNDASIILTGNTTETSVISGVMTGALEEVKGMIERYKLLYPGLQVLITGGNYEYFAKELKNSIFADPFLVLKGLDIILEYNTKK